MEYAEYRVVIDRLEELAPGILDEEGVVALEADIVDDATLARVVVEPRRMLAVEEILKDRDLFGFWYEYGGEVKQATVTLREDEPFDTLVLPELSMPAAVRETASIRPGDWARMQEYSSYGSIGWNLGLEGSLVCLSCWHIFCYLDQDTPPGTLVPLKGLAAAEILANGHVRVRFGQGTINDWDYALAKYTHPRLASNVMRVCQDGTTRPYPLDLGPQPTPRLSVQKVGYGSPVCGTGIFISFIDPWVKFRNGKRAKFRGQLRLAKMTTGGDSGSVVIRSDDQRVIGLNFAANASASLANPLYRIGWQRDGEITVDGKKFPNFKR